MTAHVVGRSADAWREAGMDGVLHKPFTIATLGLCLARFLGSGEAAAPPESAAQAETGDTPLLDPASVAQLREMAAMGRSDFVRRVTDLYFEHAPKSLIDIGAAQAAGDAETLASAAHALKSMSLNVGARRVAAQAALIETQARQSGLIAGADAIAALSRAVDEACTGLRALAQSPAQAA